MLNEKSTRRDFVKTAATGVLRGNVGGLSGVVQRTTKRVGSTAQRLREKPYEKRVCRVACYPSCLAPNYPYIVVSV